MFALVDCNNFYASCERLFRPDLEGKPIVVLSNNDGCVIARSNEAKELGIPMGAPYFKWQTLMQAGGVHVFSSNFALYGDLSRRVMSVLDKLSPELEIYSIDEAFADMRGFNRINLYKHGRQVRKAVKQWVGIPVSIGFGATKTLAKIANRVAKKAERAHGVFVLDDQARIDSVLKKVEIGDVWGVGRNWADKLKHNGIHSAGDLANADPGWIRRKYNVVLERTVRELNGEVCVRLDEVVDKQQLLVSRSFRDRVTDYNHMRQLVAGYISRACEKLRKQGSVARGITVFIRTSPFNNSPSYANTRVFTFSQYTADTRSFIRAGAYALNRIFKTGYEYQKAGIMLFDIVPEKFQQLNLFQPESYNQKARTLMKVLDSTNTMYGPQTLRIASESAKRWYMHQEFLSPAYSTRWGELLVVG